MLIFVKYNKTAVDAMVGLGLKFCPRICRQFGEGGQIRPQGYKTFSVLKTHTHTLFSENVLH